MNNNKGTSNMPSPKVADYSVKYKVTHLFISDLRRIMKDEPFIEYLKFINFIQENDGILYTSSLNEFLNALGNLPFRVVSPMIDALQNKENFSKYFEEIK